MIFDWWRKQNIKFDCVGSFDMGVSKHYIINIKKGINLVSFILAAHT